MKSRTTFIATATTIILVAGTVRAADRYWVGGSGNWSEQDHWSVSSGSRGGVSIPTVEDDVTFNSKSGPATVTIDRDVAVKSLTIAKDASADLTLVFTEHDLVCMQDCLLLGGRIDQGPPVRSAGIRTLTVSGNLDTAACQMSYQNRGRLSLSLEGKQSSWRFSGNPGAYGADGKLYLPNIWDFHAAPKGCTTTLKPVGLMQRGSSDIDVEHMCFLGDATSLLTCDPSESKDARREDRPGDMILEIHHRGEIAIDIEADGCRMESISIEHENESENRRQVISLQHKLTLDAMEVYDLTSGNWILSGPLVIPGTLSIEKTCSLDTGGHDLTAKMIVLGTGHGAEDEIIGKLFVRDATINVAGAVRVGSNDKGGLIDLGTGRLNCADLVLRHPVSTITGEKGAVLNVTGNFTVPEGCVLDLDDVTIEGKKPGFDGERRPPTSTAP